MHPEQRFRTDPATWVRDAAGRRVRTVDMHAHVVTPTVERLVADCPQKKAEPDLRLRTMGAASVAHNNAVMLPQAAAYYALDDPVIGGGGCAHADAEVVRLVLAGQRPCLADLLPSARGGGDDPAECGHGGAGQCGSSGDARLFHRQ